jgi:hypothetical protein
MAISWICDPRCRQFKSFLAGGRYGIHLTASIVRGITNPTEDWQGHISSTVNTSSKAPVTMHLKDDNHVTWVSLNQSELSGYKASEGHIVQGTVYSRAWNALIVTLLSILAQNLALISLWRLVHVGNSLRLHACYVMHSCSSVSLWGCMHAS